MIKTHYQMIYSSGFYFNQYMNELILHGNFRFYYLSHGFIDEPKRLNDIKHNFDVEFITDPEKAHYCLCSGRMLPDYFASEAQQAKMLEILETLKRNQVIMLCPNPDVMFVNHESHAEYLSGYIAQQFENMGGQVLYFGKPKAYPYEYILKTLKPKRPLMIGDTIGTDIKGATELGIDTLLVKSGVSYYDYKQTECNDDFSKWISDHNVPVTWCIDSLK